MFRGIVGGLGNFWKNLSLRCLRLQVEDVRGGPAPSRPLPLVPTLAAADSTLPPKPKEGNRLQPERTMQICANMFPIDLSEAVDRVFKYEVNIVAQDGQERDLTRAPGNE